MTKGYTSLVFRFRNQTLPKSEWTHEAHLVVALWHLLEHRDIPSTLCHLRPGIILYNHSVGTQNTESCGYHETTTVFWVKQLKEFVDSIDSRDFETLVKKMLSTPLVEKDYILKFYKKEVLKSQDARGLYMAPS